MSKATMGCTVARLLAGVLLMAGIVNGCAGCLKGKIHPKAKENTDFCAQYLAKGKLQEAEARCKIAIEYSPKFPQPYNLLGLLERMRGRNAKAMEFFKKAISLNDDFAEAHNNMGGEFFEKRMYQAAADSFMSALEIDPGYIDARRNLGTCYLHLGQLKKAHAEFLKCSELHPKNCDCRMGLGAVAMQQNEFDQARTHFTRLVQICRTDAKAWYNLGYVEFKSGHCEKAVSAFMSALALNKEMLEARHSLVKAYECVAMSNAAIKKHIEAVKKNPGYAEGHFKLGLVYLEQKLHEQALNEFLNTIKLDNNHKLAHYYSAKVFDQLLRKPETISFCKQFVTLIKSGEHKKEKAWCVQRVKALEFE